MSKTRVLRWGSLPRETQLRIARRIARRESRRIERYGPEVRAVSCGLRKKEREKGRITPTVCVRFSVDRKRKRVQLPIPAELPTRIRLDGEWFRCSVPTDVECLHRGREQYGNDVYAQPRPKDGSWASGAVTCLVADDAGTTYVMGCHHVFALSVLTPGGHGIADVDISDGNGRLLAAHRIDAPFPVPGGYAVDASIAAVTADALAQVQGTILHGCIPAVLRQKRNLEIGTNVWILAPDGTTLSGRIFDHKPEGGYLPYQGQSFWVYFDELYGLDVKSPRATLPGDSGAPVVDENWTLIGMHFWGAPQVGTSYMYPSYMLFRDWTFGRRIRLIPT